MSNESTKQEQARRWVHGYTAAGTAIVVAAVVPGTTSAALMAIEMHMCSKIGKIYRGHGYSLREAVAAARGIGLLAVAAKAAVLEGMNHFPGPGWLIKAGMAGGVIKALGEAIIAHYEKQPMLQRAASTDLQIVGEHPAAAKPSAEERLRELTQLFAQGFMSKEEFEQMRQQILRSL